MSNTKRTSLMAVNTLRARLQRAADNFLAERPYDGSWGMPYTDVCVELGLLTQAEADVFEAGIANGGAGRKWRLKKLTLLPIQFPNISYSDTMKFVSYKLQALLRDQMAYTEEQTNDDDYARAAICEPDYFYTGQALGLFTEEQEVDLIQSNEGRWKKE